MSVHYSPSCLIDHDVQILLCPNESFTVVFQSEDNWILCLLHCHQSILYVSHVTGIAVKRHHRNALEALWVGTLFFT